MTSFVVMVIPDVPVSAELHFKMIPHKIKLTNQGDAHAGASEQLGFFFLAS